MRRRALGRQRFAFIIPLRSKHPGRLTAPVFPTFCSLYYMGTVRQST